MKVHILPCEREKKNKGKNRQILVAINDMEMKQLIYTTH